MIEAGPRKRRWSLGAHLTWVVLLALLPALAIQYASNLERRQEAKVRAQEHLLQLVSDLTSQQEQVTASARQMLTTLSFLSELRRGDGPAFSRILEALQKEDPRFANLMAITPEGQVFAASVPITHAQVPDRRYFREAIESRQFTVGEYAVSRSTNAEVLHFSLPVTDGQGRITAVLAAAYDLKQFSGLFGRSGLPAETSLVVLDRAGTVLFHISQIASRYGSLVGTRLPEGQAARIMGSSHEGAYWTARRDGQPTLFAFHQIRVSDQAQPYLYLQVGRPEHQVLGESLRADRRNMLLIVITGGLALLAARAMGNRVIATPIRQLVHASRHIGRGNLYHRPALRTASREVAQLGEELGRMSLALAQRVEEQRKTEEILRNSQRLESLGVLTGGIAHDFNNLLAAVQGNLNLAQMRLEVSNPAQQSLSQAEKAVQKAADLTRQMLAYSGRGHVVVKPIDLNLVVQEMIHLLHVSLSKKTGLNLDLSPELPAVMADSAQVQQVVLNLMTNASEAIGTQDGTITLRTRLESYDQGGLEALCPAQGLQPGRFAVLEVTDTGCGMTQELLDRIFDPFFTTKPTGHGLGLSAMHGILRAHHAGLVVHSTPGSGTTFQILFPATADSPVLPVEESSGAKQIYQGLALVADDEPMVLDFAATALESLGFDVIRTKDGAEAVARFKESSERIRLVLLDLTMPRMDGLEAFTELRQLKASVPVIFSSGYDAGSAAQGLVEQGQAWFLPKPYPIRDLRRMVGEAMAGTLGLTAPAPTKPWA